MGTGGSRLAGRRRGGRPNPCRQPTPPSLKVCPTARLCCGYESPAGPAPTARGSAGGRGPRSGSAGGPVAGTGCSPAAPSEPVSWPASSATGRERPGCWTWPRSAGPAGPSRNASSRPRTSAGLAEYQVRDWRAWYARITLSMAAHAWLVVAKTLTTRGIRDSSGIMIGYTIPEIRRLPAALTVRPTSTNTSGVVTLAPKTPAPSPPQPLQTPRLPTLLSAVAVLVVNRGWVHVSLVGRKVRRTRRAARWARRGGWQWLPCR